MSYEDGWAAINLEMPRRIPRTEYSAEMHWDLIKAVTGIDVGVDSPDEVKQQAARAFMRRPGTIDFFWSTLIGHDEFGAFADRHGPRRVRGRRRGPARHDHLPVPRAGGCADLRSVGEAGREGPSCADPPLRGSTTGPTARRTRSAST